MSSAAQEALDIINGKRDEYGIPERNFEAIAVFWTQYLNSRLGQVIPVTVHPRDVAMMMVLLKVAREANRHKRDNIVDAMGYLDHANQLAEEED